MTPRDADDPMNRTERLYIYSDGASRGNPGPAGIGGQAKDRKGKVLVEVCEYLGVTTNNVAEYQALVRILEESIDLGYKKVTIRTDSELVANQVNGLYKIKSRNIIPLVSRVKSLLRSFDEAKVESIPREKNKECDSLANKAVDEGLEGEKEPAPPEDIPETQEGLF